MYGTGLVAVTTLLGDRMVTESVMGDVTVTPSVTTLLEATAEASGVATGVATGVVTGEAVLVLVAVALAVTVVRELLVEMEVDSVTLSPVEVTEAPARAVEPSGPVVS